MTFTTPPDWDPVGYAKNASFVPELGGPLIELLAPQPNERMLDLGCGDGALTLKLQALVKELIGVDASPQMVAAARARGVDARVMDGQSLGFDRPFDAVVSNAALHWMKSLPQVFAGVWTSLKPGGRFVAELGGQGNVATIVAALESALTRRQLAVLNPWFFPDAALCRQLLEAQGFRVERLLRFERPTPLPGDVSGWLETFAQSFMMAVPVAERALFIAEVVEVLRPALQQADGSWMADYVRLRFCAFKP